MDRLQSYFKAKDRSSLLPVAILHLNIVAYACAYWLTTPLLPYMTKNLGADRVTFGYLQSTLQASQIVSSLVFGQVIDKLGPRTAMSVSQIGTGLAYLLLAVSSSLTILFISRLPTVFMACMLCAQGALPRFVAAEDRATAMGRLSVSYLVGMLAGSSLSGMLSQATSHSFVGVLATLISFVMAVVTLLFVPPLGDEQKENSKAESKDQAPSKSASKSVNISEVFAMCTRSSVYPIIIATTLTGLGASIYQSQLSVILADTFHLDEASAGFTTAYGAGVGALSNTVLIPILRARYGESFLFGSSMAALSASFMLFCFCQSFELLLIILIPITASSTVLYTVAGSALSNAVGSSETGTAVSLTHSLRSACGLVAPPLGAAIFATFHVGGVGLAASMCAGLASTAFFALSDRSTVKTK